MPYTDERMTYFILGESKAEKIRRFKRVYADLKECLGTVTTNIQRIWNFYDDKSNYDQEDMEFIEHQDIPGLEFIWWGDKPRPYRYLVHRSIIAYDVGRLQTVYEVVMETLDDNQVPTDKTWLRLLDWSHNFIGYSRCDLQDSMWHAELD